jgi:hypothetical protein
VASQKKADLGLIINNPLADKAGEKDLRSTHIRE